MFRVVWVVVPGFPHHSAQSIGTSNWFRDRRDALLDRAMRPKRPGSPRNDGGEGWKWV